MWMVVGSNSNDSCRRYSNKNISNCLNSHKEYFRDSTSINPSCHRDRAEKAVRLARTTFSGNKIWSRGVLDLGAGCGDVKRFLKEYEIYIPSDIRSRDFPVLECDYGKGEIPNVESLDAIFALGIVEWMCDPHLFLKALRSYNTSIVLSYTPSDFHVPTVPLANSLTSETLETILNEAGFSILRKEIVTVRSGGTYTDMTNLLYSLTPTRERKKLRLGEMMNKGDFLFIKNF